MGKILLRKFKKRKGEAKRDPSPITVVISMVQRSLKLWYKLAMGKRILIFLHGTLIMHSNGLRCSREERVIQSINREPSVLDYENYIPIDNAVEKVKKWQSQGAEILYLSSHKDLTDVKIDEAVLEKYGFPDALIYYRQNNESYAELAEKIKPDVLIEDDCESIGGEKEMTITFIKPEIKDKIRSVVVKEFEGIDNLPDNIFELCSK